MMQDYTATPESINNAYDNGLLIKPTSVHSMYQSAKGGFIEGSKFIGDIYNKATGSPENKELNETLELIQRETNFPDQPLTQTITNKIANIAGYSINPIVIGATALGGGVGGFAVKALSKGAPKAIIPFLEKTVGMIKHPKTKELVPLTVGDIGKRLTISGSAGTGAGIPIAFEEGSASDAFMMGGIGMVFSSIPIAAGIFRKSRFKPEVKGKSPIESETPTEDVSDHITLYRGEGKNVQGGIWFTENLEQAKSYAKSSEGKVFSAKISPSDLSNLFEKIDEGTNNEHYKFIGTKEDLEKINKKRYLHQEENNEVKQWVEDYDNKTDTLENLERRATSLLQKEGFDVDSANHKLPMYIMNEANVKNLQVAASDALTANLEPSSRNYLIDYIVKNNLDELRENPKSIKIMQAYDNFLTGKLAQREVMTKAADTIHETNMKAKINNDSFLSQPEIYKAVKKLSREESHVSHLPFTMPESLERRLKLEDRIKELKKKPENKQTSRRIAELEAKLPKVLTPKEELEYIKHKLIEKEGYRNKLKSREYERLEELADHWPQARSLLDRVNMEEAYEKQLAIKQVLDQMRKVLEAPLDRLANPDNVIKYFKERLNSAKPKTIKPKVTPKKTIEDAGKVPFDESAAIEEYIAAAHESKAANLRTDSIKINDKITQFRNSETVRSDFIQCMLEAANG